MERALLTDSARVAAFERSDQTVDIRRFLSNVKKLQLVGGTAGCWLLGSNAGIKRIVLVSLSLLSFPRLKMSVP